jgi:RimJ/RimL family protein N-acetyltransferase
MPQTLNAYLQPVGAALPDWSPRAQPTREPLEGQYCRLEPLDPQRHAADLYAAYSQAADGRDWTYMAAGPFDDAASYLAHAERAAAGADPRHYAVIELKTGRALGTLALMRIDSNNGVIEVGHVAFSPLLKRTPIATEAQYLLMKHAFDALGYRRYEWKCDSLNAPSRQAAERLGFRFEGIFLQAVVYRGRTRDTAWYSIIDREWPAVRAAFERWLAPANFDAQGLQRNTLKQLRNAPPPQG